MNIIYQRKHNDSYMILDGMLHEKSYESKMIKENNIAALLTINSYSLNGESKLSYRISRKENLEDFVESTDFTINLLTRIIINIKLALDEISEYLIDENHILLNKETIFIDKGGDNFKMSLCYYPFDGTPIQLQFRELMDFFISKISNKDKEAARHVYMAYDLCLKEDYTLEEIIDFLQEYQKEEIYVEHISLKEEEKRDMDDVYLEAEYMSDYCDVEEKKSGLLRKILSGVRFLSGKLRFEDSVDEEEEYADFIIDPDYELEEKTVLLSEAPAIGRLVYDGDSNEDDFLINKDTFRIGSSQNNDAVLKARTVSKNHAKITKEGDDFYITDSNSTNGSFLNSLPLVYRKPYKLKPMDVIRFATESYIFM